MEKNRKTCQLLTAVQSRRLADGVYSLILEYPKGSEPEEVRPGQFVGVYTDDPTAMLPRPISVCGWEERTRRLRLVYRVVGKGTAQFARLEEGTPVRVLGMLGNGYDTAALAGKRVLLLGGGIGAPPMLGLAQALCGKAQVTAVMGYRTDDLFLAEEFADSCRLVIATDDGSAGFHGNVLEAARMLLSKTGAEDGGEAPGDRGPAGAFDVICACGPLPMLRGVKELSQEEGIPALISLEERMACGVGACLGCTVGTTQTDGHSRVRNARICTEGPVFRAEEVRI